MTRAAQPRRAPQTPQATEARAVPGGERTRSAAVASIVGAGLLPGALAGTQVAGLLFFLNPNLPFDVASLARAVAQYGLLLGVATLLLQLPFTWGRPARARRLLPWTLTAALAFAALLDWTHASRYAYYLPAGINVRLLKAGLWLTLAALICFYTALLHGLQRRPYGARSRWCLGLLVVLSVYVMIERRESFRPPAEPPRRLPAVERGERPRLWVVGLETATLDAVLPLAAQGRLPFLAKVVEEGVYGRLASFTPHRPEALWTTLATGKLPARHGVVGDRLYTALFLGPGQQLRLLPAGIGFSAWGVRAERHEPAGARRDALTLWEILPRLGVAAAQLGWPGAAAGAAPRAPLREVLANDLRRAAAAEALIARRPDLEAEFLVLPGLGEVSRRWFGGWAAARDEATPAGEHTRAEERAAELIAAYYEQLDRRLARLWASSSAPRLLAVVSAYGIEPAGTVLTGEALGGTAADSPDGLLMLYGEGVRRHTLLTGARLVDVAPTLLYGLGLPVARDLDGQVLTEAFDPALLERQPLTFLPSYEGLR